MDWSTIGNLGLAGVAVVVLAWVVVERSKKAEVKAESPTIPAEIFAKIVAAAVAEAVKPFKEVVENNTEALNAVQIQMAKQNGKLDHMVANTNLLLQRDRGGGG